MKRSSNVKEKVFFIIFKGLPVDENYLRPESAPLMSSLSTWAFKVTKSLLAPKLDASNSIALSKSFLVA